MIKNKILRLQAEDLRKKSLNIKKITKHFNNTGVIVVENLLKKKKCDFYINLLEKAYSKYGHLYYKDKREKKLKHSGFYNAKVVSNLHNKDIRFLKFIDNSIILKLVANFLQQGSYMESGKIMCQAFEARSTTVG